jgi:PDZ domain
MRLPRARAHIAYGVLFAASVALAACTQTGDPLARLRQATNCAAWQRLGAGALHLSGPASGSGMSGTWTQLLDARTGRNVVSVTLAGIETANGNDGNVLWTRDTSGASHRLNAGDGLLRAQTDAWLARRGWCDAPGGATVVDRSSKTEGGTTYDIVRIEPSGGSAVDLWIARSSGQLDRTVQQLNENHLVVHYRQWRPFAGSLVPFVLVAESPEDETSLRYETRDIKTVAMPLPDAFEQPPQPNDVTIRNGSAFARIPYRLEGQKPIVDVQLDGHGPFPFVLDTGGHFILTPDTARRIGAKVVGSTSNTGQGTAVLKSGLAVVHGVRIGDAEIARDVASVIPYSFSRIERGPRPPKAGWLGLSLFERFAVTIDPRSHTVTLRPLTRPRPPAPGTSLPITFSEDAPLVNCSVEYRFGPCMIDTGNAGATIVEGHWAQGNGLAEQLSRGIDLGDDVTVTRAAVGLGPYAMPREIVEYEPPAERGSEATTVEAAILSEGLINRFITTIDYGNYAAWFARVPHADARPFNRSGLFAQKQPNGSFEVTRIIARSPAERAGLRKGDRIVAVDGAPARQLSGADLADLSIAPVGTVRKYLVGEKPSDRRSVSLRLEELLP